MLRHGITTAIFACFAVAAFGADEPLPLGGNPPALQFPHFPDRAHAFVWRNWNLVETPRLALVLNTPADNVRAMAAAMGLPPEQPLTEQQRSRLYLTVIRRNWHLLPYEQLLTLLDISPRQLAYTLREDDFFWIKLGSLKPRCDRLTYAPPTPQTLQRQREIQTLVRRLFADELARPAQPPLGFLQELGHPLADAPDKHPDGDAGLRFLYSYFAVYGDPLLDPSLDPYPDELLQKLADLGVNGVWLHVVLRQLAPSPHFPEFGQDHQRRLENLRALVQRARRFGIGVYLYMNEPRAMPRPFFENRQELAGVQEGDHTALCTSAPQVRQWLTDSLAHVFSSVPDLAGVFTITASENLTNCASHHNHKACPRCGRRDPAQIIAEVNAAIEAGVHRGNPNARVLVWDWGWADDWAGRIILQLPRSCSLMSVSEWSLPITRGGVATSVGEYSISSVGPGPRAAHHWKLAREAGLTCVAKVQVNNSWELSAVPWLPVLDLVAEHCENLNAAGVDGLMLSWTLGGYPSPNLQVVQQLTRRPAPSRDEALNAIAARRYGPAGAPHARKAWTLFSQAFRHFPFHGDVVYKAPMQLGPANLLHAAPTGYAATMVGFPYDDLKGWSGPYPPQVLATQFTRLATGWKDGLAELQQAVADAPPPLLDEARADLRVALAAYLHFQSTANQIQFILTRNALADSKLADAQRRDLADRLRGILRDEADIAARLFAIARQDPRIGFEASNHYYYLPQDLVEKVLNCHHLINRYAAEFPTP